MPRNRGKQENGKDQRSLQENWRYQGSISWKDGDDKGREYTEELYKKDLNDPDNRNRVITHLEPDILECEFK